MLLLTTCTPTPKAKEPPAAAPVNAQAAPKATPDTSEDGVVVLDLEARTREWTQKRPNVADLSQTFFTSNAGTLHMHALGLGQMTPLHIHRNSDEIAIIVSGAPHVTQMHAKEGRLQAEQHDPKEGAVFFSPRFCGHEWVNPALDRMQSNLVIAVPGFEGNLFVKADDPRLLQGGAPRMFDPAELAAAFAKSGEPSQWKPLEMLGEKLGALLVRSEYVLRGKPGPAMMYVVAGSASLQTSKRELPLQSHSLVLFPGEAELRVTATPAAPLLAYVFRP